MIIKILMKTSFNPLTSQTYYIWYVYAHIVPLAHNAEAQSSPRLLGQFHWEDIVDILLFHLRVVAEYLDLNCGGGLT